MDNKKKIFLIILIIVIILAIFISTILFIKFRDKKVLNNFENALKDIGESKNLSFTDGDNTVYYTEKAVAYKDKTGNITIYSNEDSNIVIDNQNKIATVNKSANGVGKPKIYINFGYFNNLDEDKNIEDIEINEEDKLKDVVKISKGEFKGTKCYIIEILDEKFYVDKDTYMPIAMEESANKEVIEYNIKLNSVTEADVAYPDFTDYQITELKNDI